LSNKITRLPVFSVWLGVGSCIYLAMLVALYRDGIIPVWTYLGAPTDPNAWRVALAALSVFLGGGMLTVRRASSFYLLVTFLVTMVPTFALYIVHPNLLYLVAVTAGAFALIALLVALPRLPLPRFALNFPPKVAAAIMLLISSTILLAVVMKSGLATFNLNLMAVYEFRDQANAALSGSLAYLVPIATNAALPLALLIGLQQRSFPIVFFCIVMSILYFGFVSLKSYLFYPLMVAGVYFLIRREKCEQWISVSLIALVLFCLVEMVVFLSGDWPFLYLTAFTARRMLFIPNIINYFYLDFFQSSEFYFWSTSKISLGLISSPYGTDMADLVGSAYLNEGNHANTGWVGSGYGQAGLFGVAVYSVLFGVLVKLFDSFAHQTSNATASAFFFVPAITMITSSDTLSVFFTQGLLPSLVLFCMFRKSLAAPCLHAGLKPVCSALTK
jgi:hypothetical protein